MFSAFDEVGSYSARQTSDEERWGSNSRSWRRNPNPGPLFFLAGLLAIVVSLAVDPRSHALVADAGAPAFDCVGQVSAVPACP